MTVVVTDVVIVRQTFPHPLVHILYQDLISHFISHKLALVQMPCSLSPPYSLTSSPFYNHHRRCLCLSV